MPEGLHAQIDDGAGGGVGFSDPAGDIISGGGHLIGPGGGGHGGGRGIPGGLGGGAGRAEWVSVSVEGAPGDVAVYAVTGEGDTVPGRSTGSVNLKIVSRSDGSRERVYHVEYYVFGMRRRVSVREQ